MSDEKRCGWLRLIDTGKAVAWRSCNHIAVGSLVVSGREHSACSDHWRTMMEAARTFGVEWERK